MTEEIKPCWCSGNKVVVSHRPFLKWTLWRVKCHSYACAEFDLGTYGFSRESAIRKWNKKRERYADKWVKE